MAIAFVCEQCQKRYEVDAALAGRRVKCKSCGAALTVPGRQSPPPGARPATARAPVDDVADRYGLDDDAPPARSGMGEVPLPRAGGGRRPGGAGSSSAVPAWVWVAGGIAGLVLVAVTIALMSSRRAGNPPAAPVPTAKGEPAPEVIETPEPAPAPASAPTAAEASLFKRDDASAAPAATSWRLRPDPAPEALEFPPIAKLAIPVPESYSGFILYPTTPSPFVIMGGNDNADQSREVWDLRTVRKVGRLSGKIESAKPMALSPDGAYFVVHTNPVPRTTDIWRVADAKRIGRIEDGASIPDLIDFAGPGEGRVVIGTSYAKVLQVWDFLNGKPLFKIATPANFEAESAALSPGRRYLALAIAQKNRVQVFDLSTGQLAGEVEIPKEGSSNHDCEGMAFAPDGTALTGLFTVSNSTHLMTWDVATGALASDFAAEGNNAYGKSFSYTGRAVQWLPGGSGWLIYDQSIVERQSGQVAWTLPFAPIKYKEHGPRKILDLGRVIRLAVVNDRQVLRLDPLPKDKIQTALTLARGGGSAVDATLPPIKPADLGAARKVAAIAGPVPWTAVPGAAPAAKSPTIRSIPLRVASGDILALLVSGPDANQAIVVSSPGGRLAGTKGKQSQEPRRVDRYDLAAGRPLGTFEIASVSTPIALSPGATHVLLSHAGGPDRLDVHAADGKPVAGWRPYDAESGDDRNVAWADFLAPGQVLTVNPAGTLILWSLPDCKAVYVAAGAMQGVPILRPDRKTLAVLRDGRLRLLDPATGAPQGDATASGHPGAAGLKVAAFGPDGGELAAVLDETIVRWDLKTGQVVEEIPSPLPRAGMLQYGNARHVLLDGKVLFDLASKKGVWYYEGGVHPRGGSGGLHVYAAADQIIGPATLATIEVPDRKAVQAEAAAADPKTKPLIGAGAKVSVQVVGQPVREAERFHRELIDALTAQLQAVGVEVADGQPVTLVVEFRELETGRSLELRMIGTGETRTIQVRHLGWQLSVVGDKGPGVPIAGQTVGLRGPGLIEHIPKGENDWEGYLRTRQWFAGSAEVMAHGVPYFVAQRPDGGVFLPGWSFLGYPTY